MKIFVKPNLITALDFGLGEDPEDVLELVSIGDVSEVKRQPALAHCFATSLLHSRKPACVHEYAEELGANPR